MRDAYIVDAIRTPIGKFQGTLSPVRTDDLAALVIKELMNRNGSVDWEAVDDVIMGCANQAGEDNRNVARMALLLAGMPWKVPGETVNRLCSSGMSAAVQARRAIAANEGDLFVTGGVEHMTRGPWVMSKASKPYGNDSKLYDSSFGWRFVNKKMHELYGTHAMGETAENLVDKFGISREDQDKFAYWSQMKAAKAQESGRLAEEIIPVEIPRRKQDPLVFEHDEFIKANTTLDVLGNLRAAFRKDGSVTAGNASGLNDGAGAMLIASEDGLKQHDLTPKARIVSSAVCGVLPEIMGIGPVDACKLALKRAGLSIDDMDILEFNEAFAVQTLSCTRELGVDDDDERINPNGGAIAIGHPLGMTGSRILQTATIELHKQQKEYALVAMCVGVGQGYATIIERV